MIKVYDEFTQLKEVILGNINKELVKYVPKDEQSLILDIFDQTIEDLDEIQKIYQDNGIIVHRPKLSSDYSNIIFTPNSTTKGVRNPLSPRDAFIVIGNTLLETAGYRADMMFEHLFYKNIFLEQYKNNPCKWIKMPTPSYDKNCVGELGVSNAEPIIDAAQIMRLGDSLIVSNTGAVNEQGIDWMRRHFPDYKIVEADLKGHIDAQIKIIRPGLMITPYTKSDLPKCLQNYDIIKCNDNNNDLITNGMMFRDDDVENTFPSCALTSLNENCVFVYEHYKEVYKEFIKQLEKHNVEVIFVPLRHQHWFNQGITCLTMELHRAGDKEKYV